MWPATRLGSFRQPYFAANWAGVRVCWPLSVWTTRTQALPTQFEQTRRETVKLVEPKAFHLKLPKASLKTESDVDAWLKVIKTKIMTNLNDPDKGSVEV